MRGINRYWLWLSLPVIVLLFALRPSDFVVSFETGVLIGAALVVFGLYPAILRGHEKRLTALERGAQSSERASEA